MHHGPLTKEEARGLKVLRDRIGAAGIPPSKLDETMTIATWNVRELGRRAREPLALHYIAEIIGQFDLVALVELRDDVTELSTILRYLGPYWRVVYSDFQTDDGGNRERVGYVYDERSVTFTGLSSHAFLPRKKVGTEYLSDLSFWRQPYIASFRSGDFDFVAIATHIRWGSKESERVGELTLLADWIESRMHERYVVDRDVIVLGDFNIPSVDSPLFQAISQRGLQIPAGLLGARGTDLARKYRYDQILHYATYSHSFTNVGGSLDFYAGDHRPLFPGKSMTRQQFTYQLSDHLPLWVQLDVDTDDERLDQILAPRRR